MEKFIEVCSTICFCEFLVYYATSTRTWLVNLIRLPNLYYTSIPMLLCSLQRQFYYHTSYLYTDDSITHPAEDLILLHFPLCNPFYHPQKSNPFSIQTSCAHAFWQFINQLLLHSSEASSIWHQHLCSHLQQQ